MKPLDLDAYPRIVFFAGAGMSAESGVPTYRGKGGIWEQYDYREYACERAFRRDPAKVLDFHELRRAKVLDCAPHAGHAQLAALQAARPGVTVVTPNIDGLLQRAGVAVAAELHGSLWRLRCERHGVWTDDEAGGYRHRHCVECGAWLRPDIVWFEDMVDDSVFERAAELVAEADLFVSIGTSAVVYPAAGFASLARQRGAYMVEINPEATAASDMHDLCLRYPASEALVGAFPLRMRH